MLYSISPKSAQRWINSVGLAIVVGIAYFLAARLSLFLLTDGVAVFWPAAGVSSGVLISLGSRARLPVIAGTMAATVAANLLGDRNIWSAIVFALSNALEAGLVAALIERHFGESFSLDRLRNVIGLLAATIVATAISGISGTLGFELFHSSPASIPTIWHHWFAVRRTWYYHSCTAPDRTGFKRCAIRRHAVRLSKAPWRWSC